MANSFSDRSLGQYARTLGDSLRKVLAIELEGFERFFVWQARRVGFDNYEDLGSLVVVECLEQKKKGKLIDDAEVRRAVDRIRHRIVRRARREVSIDLPNLQAERSEPNPIEEREEREAEAARLREFAVRLGQLSPIHVLLFERVFMKGDHARRVADELRMSRATVYRNLHQIRNRFRHFLEERGEPAMQRFRGKLLANGKTLLDAVSGVLEMHTSPGGVRSWDGYFGVPAGKYIEPGEYQLVLEDGRSGVILVNKVRSGSHQATTAGFKGSGPLQ